MEKILEFLKEKSFDSFNNKRYWIKNRSKKVDMFSLQGEQWYNCDKKVNTIEEIEATLNK